MKMLSWLFVAFITLAVTGCQTTQSESQAPAPGQNLIGDWKGSWSADSGASGAFAVKILSVSKGGRIVARRSSTTKGGYATEHVSMGKISGNQVELDRGKGKNTWIKMSLKKVAGGVLMLKGSYSAMAGKKGEKKAVQGEIWAQKAK